MGLLKTLVWWLAGLLLGAVIGALYALERWYTSPAPGLANQTVLVPMGTTYSAIVERWRRAEFIDAPRLWRVAGRLTGAESRIQAGEYQIPAVATPQEILAQLSQGQGLISYKVAVIEGWTVREMRSVLGRAQALRHTLKDVPDDDLLARLGFPPGPAEGWFFPDTYAYNRGDTDADILRRAHERMRQALAEAWSARSATTALTTPYEALTLASIVEKETGRASDRGQISQVFNRRLQLGMKLQTDPTVIYGVGPSFDGDITRAHLRTDTPYNTYTRHGLPPTPIALPGKDSLQAALHPAEGEYLYFVARGDGTSEFSATLAEHNAAVRRYQLN